MERMRANPKIREWWAMTDGMQVCYLVHAVLSGANVFAGESYPWCCE